MATGFQDRLDAGNQLAAAMAEYRDSDAVVLGLARGGVVVGYAVARALNLALRPFVVRKIGAPDNPELALGAISETGVQWLDGRIVDATGATPDYLDNQLAAQAAEARRREARYTAGREMPPIHGHPAIVVDDGIATGASALVAVRSARNLGASSVILAVPVASPQAVSSLKPSVDSLVVLHTPEPFLAVGFHYRQFDQVTDDEVLDYLRMVTSAEEPEA